jgi:small subunit ribosomal protein S36
VAIGDRVRRIPSAVWATTVLFVVVLSAWTVALPIFHAPDEPQHVDLIGALAADPSYPDYDGRVMGITVRRLSSDYLNAGSGPRSPELGGTDPPALAEVAGLGMPGSNDPRPGALPNQMPQHPPLYYEAMAAALRVERAAAPGPGTPSLAREVALLRLLNVALLASLPLAAWTLVRRLGGTDRAGVAAGVALLAVPQFAHIGASVNNDNLLVVAGAWLAVVLAQVMTGDQADPAFTGGGPRRRLLASVRFGLVVGLVLTVGLLTKAFAFLFIPWVIAAYALAARRSRRVRDAAAGLAAAGLVAVLGAGWFWAGNLSRHGTVAPTIFDERAPHRPPGLAVDSFGWLRRFGAWFTYRFWGWFGLYSARVPWLLVVVATLLLALALALAFLPRSRRATKVAGVPRQGRTLDVHEPGDRPVLGVMLLPVALVGGYTLVHAYGVYVNTSWSSFIQGRYLFSTIVPLMAVAAMGLSRLGRGYGPRTVLVLAGVAQVFALGTILHAVWGGPGTDLVGEARTLVQWSAWPGEVVAVALVVAALLAAASAAWIWRASDPLTDPA